MSNIFKAFLAITLVAGLAACGQQADTGATVVDSGAITTQPVSNKFN